MYIISAGVCSLTTPTLDFNNPQGAVLGVINAAFSIGAVLALPVVPYINDRVGRKHSITIGSVIILVGVVLQTASVNSEKPGVAGVTSCMIRG